MCYIGTSGWVFSDWAGDFYPKNLERSCWLKYYAQHFNTVEVNATFYRSFKETTYLKWYQQVPDNFKYILKAPKIVTHHKLLADAEGIINTFEKSALSLQEKLGLMLLQLPPHMPYLLPRLEQTLKAFNYPQKVVVEFRKKYWITKETLQLLKKYQSILCLIDSPDIKLTATLTANIAYIRLHGSEQWYKYKYNQSELAKIAAFIKRLIEFNLSDLYIIFNNTFFANAPYNALQLKEMLKNEIAISTKILNF